jgi:DNA-binding MltR family transcriptional regulator
MAAKHQKDKFLMSEDDKQYGIILPKPFDMEKVYKRLPYLKEMSDLLRELDKESDRGKVLISCSLLDEFARRMLLAFMVDCAQSKKLVEGFNAPLGTFSTRISALYAFGLISTDEFKELENLRKIRNKFAHEIYVSFEDQQIKDLVKNLTFIGHKVGNGEEEVGASELFTYSVAGLVLWIGNRHITIEEDRRKELPNTYSDS